MILRPVTLLERYPSALILTGPTASGKTALALDLAERLNAEILAMDSMTLYRGMDIGTAKPSQEERSRVPHHLLDLLNPWESANVAWWLEQAQQACEQIQERGKRILFVGGTPFYLKALMHGLFDSPPIDPALRLRLEQEAVAMGAEAFHAKLMDKDPITAKRLHPNDTRRIVRALEVWELTGRPISSWQQQNWFSPEGESSTVGPQMENRCLAIDLPRNELYARIDSRVSRMMDLGWIEEVVQLRKLPYPLSKEASQALGYKEINAYLDGTVDQQTIIETIQTRTRQFAKRQLTWFRNLDGCQLQTVEKIIQLWNPK